MSSQSVDQLTNQSINRNMQGSINQNLAGRQTAVTTKTVLSMNLTWAPLVDELLDPDPTATRRLCNRTKNKVIGFIIPFS
jgi:hypothetical protein